ncbi:TetR/AcrR family transcriptional regulator [Massilia cavernae]|uniref:TetR/AcrR family transcriptional regulator n=1 Tax=Massilia cavernae TaxID=2320864 RepID=A0A418Y6N6_9BURK|nr:TetR/AcrR family transcriptional regulator [Massilia cavernae]RJG24137.1 TetR/AcrR family transcriptional regulator [Massilia cavernae]
MKQKTETRRQAILDVAAAVFREMGYERASMDTVSQRGGGSKATIYNYFSSKEELFFDVIFRATEAEFEASHAALDADGPNVATALEQFGQRLLSLLYSPDVLAVRRLVIAEGGRSGLGKKCYEMAPARSDAMLAQFLQKEMDLGKLRKADARIAARHLKGLLESEHLEEFHFHTLEPLGKDEIAAIAQRAVAVFMAAYGPISSK